MAAGLGELILRVGANISEFVSAANKIEAELGRMRKSFNGLGSDIGGSLTRNLAGLAAAVGGVQAAFSAVTSSLKLGDELQAINETFGGSVEVFDRLSIAAALNGASLADIGKAAKETNKSMVESLDSTSKAAQLYDALGISVKKADGSFKSTQDVLQDTMKALSGITNETQRTAIGTELLGKSYISLAPTIKNFAEDSERAEETIRRFGGVSTETAALVDALGDEFTILSEGGKRALLNSLTPAIEVARAALVVFSDVLAELTKGSSNADWALVFANVLGDLGNVVLYIINAFKLFSAVLAEIGQTALVAFSGLNVLLSLGSDESFAQLDGALEGRNQAVKERNAAYERLVDENNYNIDDKLKKQVEMYRLQQKAIKDLVVNSDQNDRLKVSLDTAAAQEQGKKLGGVLDRLAVSGKAAKDELADFAAKMAAANFADSIGLDEKTVESYAKLTLALKAGKLAAEDYEPAISRLLDADSKLKKEQDELNKALDASVEAQRKGAQAAADYLAKMIEEGGAIGLTGNALIDYNAQLKLTAALTDITDESTREAIEGYVKSAAAIEKNNEARKKSFEAYSKGIQAGKDLIGQLQAEIGAYGKTGVELAVYNVNLARKAALLGVTEQAQIDAINKEYDYAASLAKTSAQMALNVESTKALADQFSSLGDDAVSWTEAFIDDSEAAFKRAGEAFKKYLVKVILEATVKPFVINFLANITGNSNAGNLANANNNPLGPIGSAFNFFGGNNAAGGAAGEAGGFLSTLSSVGSSFSTLSNIFTTGTGLMAGAASAFSLSSAGAAIGLSELAVGAGAAAEVGAAAAGTATALTAAGAGFVAIIPVIGWIAAAAIVAYSIWGNKGGGPKDGGFATMGDVSGITNTDSTGRYFTPSGNDSVVQDLLKATDTSYQKLVDLFGGKATAGFALGFDTDPQGTAGDRTHAGVFVNGQQVFNEETDLGHDSGKIEDTLTLAAQRSLLAALKASELPERIAEIFDSIDVSTASAEDIQDAINLATGVQQISEIVKDLPAGLQDKLLDAFDGTEESLEKIGNIAQAFAQISEVIAELPDSIADKLIAAFDGTEETAEQILQLAASFGALQSIMDAGTPLDEALRRIANASATAADRFVYMEDAVGELLTGFDGTAEAAFGLAAATASFYESAVQLVAEIEQVKTSLSGMFGDTKRTLTLTTLSEEEKYTFLQNETEGLRALINSSTDPGQIRSLAERVNQNILDAFSLLDPEEQAAQLNQFLANVDAFNEEVNTRLDAVESDVQQSVESVLEQVRTDLNTVADKMVEAANTQQDAADTSLAAANTPVVVIVETKPIAPQTPRIRGDVNG